MAQPFLMKNPTSDQVKTTYIGYSWTMLFFNAFAPLFRGDGYGLILLVLLNIATYLASPNLLFYWWVAALPGFVYSFFWNKTYTERLIKKGFIFSESEEKNKYAEILLKKPNTFGYILCALCCGLNIYCAFNMQMGIENYFNNLSTDNSSPVKYIYTPSQSGWQDEVPSTLSPYGHLAEVFNLNSDYTDLQREETLSDIKGKIVEWELPLYEISREKSSNEYTLFFNPKSNSVGCIVIIKNPTKAEIDFMREAKTGDMITFKGIISGDFMRSLKLSPAKIITSNNCQTIIKKDIKGKFKFIECRGYETDFPHIALMNINDKEEYAMITDKEDIWDYMCKKLKKGTVININYAVEHRDDELNGDYDAYVIYSYKR